MGGGVAIASAVASLLTLVAAIVGLVFALGAGKPPSLVCTYTFKIHNKFTVWPSGTVHESNETWYSDDKRLSMWTTYADKWTKITYKDDLVYVVQSYFNRTLCTMLESASGCMGMTVGVKEMKWQHPCPGNESIMCDVWSGASKTYNETWYLLPDDEDGTSDGRVPMGYSTNTSDGYLLASFTRVTLDEPTDADAFETPAASKCFDMTDYGRKRSVASSPLRKRERFAINKLTGQREWNKLGDELLNPEGAMDEPEGGSTWTARRYPQFDGLTYRQLGERLTWPGRMSFMAAPLVEGADHSKLQVHRAAPKSFKSVGALPESFDATDEWSSCSKTVTKIRDQGNCGSCWAFGTTEVLADRKCIKDGSLSFNSPLSPQHVMDCYGENGCGGGYTDVAMLRFTQNGTVTDSCMPYREESRECRTTCSSTETIAYYKADTAYTLYGDSHPADTVTLMQQDLQTHGPLGVSFYVMSDFYDYESGVYQHKSSATNQGMHAVKLVGWGVEAGVPYWKVANSWGTSWGESGFFRIRRGINECGIEEMVFSCTAA